jgi:N-methylhydantoinase B
MGHQRRFGRRHVEQMAGSEEIQRIPSKIDNLKVDVGDRIIYRTAGSGGWGDPLERPFENVAKDVWHDLVSVTQAKEGYGVIIEDRVVNVAASEALRLKMRHARGPAPLFDPGILPPMLLEAAE